MAQLPPKIPTHQKLPFMPSFFPFPTAAAADANGDNSNSNPSWVDEFLDFSAARRGAHRRSSSDSVTFLEASSADDEDQLIMSMFSDGVPPSSPSDRNSFNDERAARVNGSNEEAEEGESDECNVEARTQEEPPAEEKPGPLDPKRVKR